MVVHYVFFLALDPLKLDTCQMVNISVRSYGRFLRPDTLERFECMRDNWFDLFFKGLEILYLLLIDICFCFLFLLKWGFRVSLELDIGLTLRFLQVSDLENGRLLFGLSLLSSCLTLAFLTLPLDLISFPDFLQLLQCLFSFNRHIRLQTLPVI